MTETYPPIAGERGKLKWLRPGELVVDHTYQRSLGGRRARKIAREWHWHHVTPLTVAARDNALFVVDGQHQLAAAKLRGDIHSLPCYVVDGDLAGEAESCGAHNAERNNSTAIAQHRMWCVAQRPDALEVQAICEAHGLTLLPLEDLPNGAKFKRINCKTRLYGIHRTYGAQALSETLDLCVGLGPEFEDLAGISGAGKFLSWAHQYFGEAYKAQVVIERVVKLGPSEVLKARNDFVIKGVKPIAATVLAMAKVHDRRQHKRRHLLPYVRQVES